MKFYLAVSLPSWIFILVWYAYSPDGALGVAIGSALAWHVIARDLIKEQVEKAGSK